MLSLKALSSLLPFLHIAFAGPLKVRQNDDPQGAFGLRDPIWPVTLIAMGDSFSAGIGAGHYAPPDDLSDVKMCKRFDGSYPTQLKPMLPHVADNRYWFVSCSGAILESKEDGIRNDIDAQLVHLEGRKAQVATLSISGNDFGFAKVVKACIYNWDTPTDILADAACTRALDDAEKLVNGDEVWKTYIDKATTILDKVVAGRITGIPVPWGVLVITGYARFFADPVEGDWCDNNRFPLGFLGDTVFKGNLVRASTRKRMNELVMKVNDRIRTQIVPLDSERVGFIDIDEHFDGKRFCEPGRNTVEDAVDPPVDGNKVWFNSLTSNILEDDFVPSDSGSDLEQAWQGSDGSGDFRPRKIQQISSFHPKTPAHARTAEKIRDFVVAWGTQHGHNPSPPPQQCYNTDAQNIPAKVVGDNGKLFTPNEVLYKLREVICSNKCSHPTEIPQGAVAFYKENDKEDARCEISVLLEGGSEAYMMRDRSTGTEAETQNCWDSTMRLIDTCVQNTNKHGWQGGVDPAPGFYQTGIRRKDQTNPDFPHNSIPDDQALEADISGFQSVCSSTIPYAGGDCQKNDCDGAWGQCTFGKYAGCNCARGSKANKFPPRPASNSIVCKDTCCKTRQLNENMEDWNNTDWWIPAWCNANCGGRKLQYC